MLFKHCFHWQLPLSIQSYYHFIKNIRKEFVQYIGSLKYLENNLQKDGALSVVGTDRRFSREHSLICYSHKHLNHISALCNPLIPIHQIPVHGVQQSVPKSILVLLKNKFQAREHLVNNIR